MGAYAASELIKAMIKSGQKIADARVLIMGLTFKENCPDLRNTRVVDVIRELREFGCDVVVTDCCADNAEAQHEYGLTLVETPEKGGFEAVIIAVPHREYAEMSPANFRDFLKPQGVLFDLKGTLPLGGADLRL